MIPVWITLLDTEERNKLEKLYIDYYKQMEAVAKKVLTTQQDVEDAVYNAFHKIANNMSCLENRTINEVHAFCIVVVRNAATDILRSNIKRYNCISELNEDITPDPLNIIEQYELEEIKKYITKLPEELMEAIWMYHLMGIPVENIAEIQNVKRITVYKRIERGESKLLKMLKAGEENAD